MAFQHPGNRVWLERLERAQMVTMSLPCPLHSIISPYNLAFLLRSTSAHVTCAFLTSHTEPPFHTYPSEVRVLYVFQPLLTDVDVTTAVIVWQICHLDI